MNTPAPNWSTILFDLDGTLIDSVALVLASYKHAFTKIGHEPFLQIPESEIRSWIGIPLPATFEALDPARAEQMTAYFREFNETNHDDWVHAFDGIPELVTTIVDHANISDLALGVVTAKRRDLAQQGLDVTGIGTLPLLTAMEDTTAHKPDPAPILAALDACGRGQDGTVYVGDAPTDLRAASNAGVAAIGVTWGAATRTQLEAEHPIAVADTVEELAALLHV